VLTVIPDLPENVVGVEAHERVTAEDYESVLVPAVKAAEAASKNGKIRVLYVLGPEFPDFTAGAAWEDTKLGLSAMRHLERTALVGDSDWLWHVIQMLRWAMPGEVRVFATENVGEARAWVTARE
jgi:hypothetical protein